MNGWGKHRTMANQDLVAPEIRLERARIRALKRDKLGDLLLDTQVVGLLTLLGGLYAAQRIPWSDDESRNDMIRGVATTGVVLISLTRAGLTGWPAAAAAGIAGAASIESSKPLVEFKIPDWLKNL
jgi:hypothetical protein